MEKFIIDGQYPELLKAHGIDSQKVLKKAGLPIDTFAHPHPKLSEEQYFKMLDIIGKLSGDPMFPIRLVKSNRLETFSAPILAAYCSKDGFHFIKRLARYKKLIGPVSYQLTPAQEQLTITLTTLSGNQILSPFFVTGELAFLIEMISRATEQSIKPLSITTTFPVSHPAMVDFFGIQPIVSDHNSLTFSSADLQIPFTSRNLSLLDYLEPQLKNRLAELEVDDSYGQRVRTCLVELLPRGLASADDVARQLGISKRTLQRKLKQEDTNFQQQLNATREMLAKNYLLNTDETVDEIAYLLAYQETNSFLRAFNTWTGQSVQQFRQHQS